jgi:hypothetical protein
MVLFEPEYLLRQPVLQNIRNTQISCMVKNVFLSFILFSFTQVGEIYNELAKKKKE